MTPRLLLAGPYRAGTVELSDAHAHYLKRVLRLKPGAEVVVYDGMGTSWHAVTHADDRSLGLELLRPRATVAAPAQRIWLALAVIKAMDSALRKAVELGATDLLPFESAYTNRPANRDHGKERRHWSQILESAAAQCEQDHLPALHERSTYEAIISGPPTSQTLLLDPRGEPWPQPLPQASTTLIIGPEGGFSDEELELARNTNVPIVRMGSLILRAETAPLAALVRLQTGWELTR
ncbi:MAG: RsmE family RNA methyltransferase [Pseudomonadota bacterium]